MPVLLRSEVWFELSDYSEYQPRKKCGSDWWLGSPENLEKAEKTEMEGKPPSLGLILHPTGVSSYDLLTEWHPKVSYQVAWRTESLCG